MKQRIQVLRGPFALHFGYLIGTDDGKWQVEVDNFGQQEIPETHFRRLYS